MVAASIVFDQGGAFPAGRAAVGTAGSPVQVTNEDNTDIVAWSIWLAAAPEGSVTYSAASTGVPQILGSAIGNTPLIDFTPDAPGEYRIVLDVEDAGGSKDRDIRMFAVPSASGLVLPTMSFDPLPIEIELSGVIPELEVAAKAHERNYSGQKRGWEPSLTEYFRKYRDYLYVIINSTPYAPDASDVPPMYLIGGNDIGGPATINLPTPAYEGQTFFFQADSAEEIHTINLPGGHTFILTGGSSFRCTQGHSFGVVYLTGTFWTLIGPQPRFEEHPLLLGLATTTDDSAWAPVGYIDYSNFLNPLGYRVNYFTATDNASDGMSARLYDLDDSSVVTNSTLTNTSTTPSLESGSVILVPGSEQFAVEIKLASQAGGTTGSIYSAVLKTYVLGW